MVFPLNTIQDQFFSSIPWLRVDLKGQNVLWLEWSFYCLSSSFLRSSQPHGSQIFCWNTLTSSRGTRSPLSLATEVLVSQRSKYGRWFESHFSSRNRSPHSVRIFWIPQESLRKLLQENPSRSRGFLWIPESSQRASIKIQTSLVIHCHAQNRLWEVPSMLWGLYWTTKVTTSRFFWGTILRWPPIIIFHFPFPCLLLCHSGPLNRCTPPSIAEI